MRGRPPVPEIDRFMLKFKIDAKTGCWNWTAGIDKDGYGRFYYDERKGGRAHIFSYRHFIGPVNPALTIDHKCRNRHCVNPNHLRQITGLENTMIGVGPGPTNLKKTHCPKGHPYDSKNTYIDKRGFRYCRICKRNTVNKNSAENTARWRQKHGVYWSRSQGCYVKKHQ
jgi:hypothetical protein